MKFAVCCTLIISLFAPSYAALSASDGSSFVTKAEFDSALADFNARLTTFEAGINSKIDSQVSSFLDRNGIWSGKEQTLEINPNRTQFSSALFNQNEWIAWGSATTVFIANNADLQKCLDPNGHNFYMTVVFPPFCTFKANKSGMLIWDYGGGVGGYTMIPDALTFDQNYAINFLWAFI